MEAIGHGADVVDEVSFKGKSSLFSIFRLHCTGSFSFLATLGTFDTNSY